jgi:DNA polymerase-4
MTTGKLFGDAVIQTKPRKILHLDLDAFFCAVEENSNPSLRGKPFAVGGLPNQRGVVASCSYAARQFGVHSAMPMSQAVRLCPGLVIVRSRHGEYSRVSRQVMDILHNLTPFVEQISIDEAFLDVTMLRDEAEAIARSLQVAINADLNLPCSLGVASNKLVAKIANNIGKSVAGKDAPPNAVTVIAPGNEAAFLGPLPVRELWGVGPKTAERLAGMGIRTIRDIAAWPVDDLVQRFGKMGAEISERARGVDNRPVETESETKSVSREITFNRDVTDGDQLRRTLLAMSDEIGRKLRQDGLTGTTIKLKLRWADFTTLTRQITLDSPTHHDTTIYEAALYLFERAWPVGRPVRLIGVGVSGFEHGGQLSLWDSGADEAEQERLESALDKLRDRFGDHIIRRGSNLRRGK